MNFYEFLIANNEKMLIDFLREKPLEKLSKDFESKLLNYLNNYYIVGGMPEVVESWIEYKDIEKVEEIQNKIINSYEFDFAKHAPINEIQKLNYIWNYIPVCLSKENTKFIYGHVKPGARAKDLEDSLGWLLSAGLCYKVDKIKKHAMPVSSYVDLKSFKIYLSDVGILRCKAKVDASYIISNDKTLYKEFKGSMAENFVLEELLSINNNNPYYWTSNNIAELDFVWQLKEKILPIEVKSGENIHSKGLHSYIEQYQPNLSIRFSTKNIDIQEKVINIPLYLIWNIKNILNSLDNLKNI